MAKMRIGAPIATRGRVLGVDVGEARVGLAITDPDQLVATPNGIVEVTELGDVDCIAQAIAGAGEHHDVVGFVVGLPRMLNGREGAAAQNARRVAKAVREATGRSVAFVDERFTSVEAERVMASDGMDSRARRGKVDEIAASLILTAWLERRRAQAG